jgi:LytTr DNA-binding domain
MIAEAARHSLRHELTPMLVSGFVAVLMFAGYCQVHSWFAAEAVPATTSLQWGLAMGIPSAVAACWLWRQAPHLAQIVGRGAASIFVLWAGLVAAGVTTGALVHLLIGDGLSGSFLVPLLERMYDLLPEVGALSAFIVSYLLLRRAPPEDREPLTRDLNEWLNFPEAPSLFLKTSDICFLRSAGNYCEIHAHGRTHLVRITLSVAADRLAPLGFVRIHRTLIVNVARIAFIDRGFQNRNQRLRLDNGDMLPIGKAYVLTLKRKLRLGEAAPTC